VSEKEVTHHALRQDQEVRREPRASYKIKGEEVGVGCPPQPPPLRLSLQAQARAWHAFV
jgi:hypothetical protein